MEGSGNFILADDTRRFGAASVVSVVERRAPCLVNLQRGQLFRLSLQLLALGRVLLSLYRAHNKNINYSIINYLRPNTASATVTATMTTSEWLRFRQVIICLTGIVVACLGNNSPSQQQILRIKNISLAMYVLFMQPRKRPRVVGAVNLNYLLAKEAHLRLVIWCQFLAAIIGIFGYALFALGLCACKSVCVFSKYENCLLNVFLTFDYKLLVHTMK